MIYLNDQPVTPTVFPDGTSQVWKLDLKRRPNRVVWRFENEAEVMHLMQLLQLLQHGNGSADVFVPYLPYARQDKQVSNDATFALATFVAFAKATSYANWHLLDPHPSSATEPLSLLKATCVRPDIDRVIGSRVYDLIVFPDAGARFRYDHTVPASICQVDGQKVRDHSTGRITRYSLPSLPFGTKRILVIDDLCDGGATFEALGQAVRSRIDAPIDLFVTHGIFSKGLSSLLETYDRILTTDSFHASLRDPERLHVAAQQNPRFKEFETAMKSGRLVVMDSLEMLGYSPIRPYATANEGTQHVG